MENKILSLLPKAFLPREVYFGRNSLLYLKSMEGQKNLVVVSRTVWEKHRDKVSSGLAKCENEFMQFSSEPKKKDVEDFQERVKRGGYSAVIGIGGGSVLDLAKTAKLADANARLILVPTTPGTGSEASRYSLVLDENGEKEVISSDRMVPDVVLLDPAFASTLPKFETVYTSMDIIAHALEGLVSRMSNPLTDSLAVKSLDMVLLNLKKALDNPLDMEAREGLQIAGFLAGIVQSSASVGIVHSFAHYFGPKMGMPHGMAVGHFLLDGLKFNSQRTDRYKKLDSSCLVNSRDFIQKIGSLLSEVGFYENAGPDFSGLDFGDAPARIKNDLCTKTNPCQITEDEIREIIRSKA
jgi:alcohol dehydrogenase class IV